MASGLQPLAASTCSTRMQIQPRPLPAAADLWERYSYNPLTGELFSLKRPTSGKPLGYLQANGYIKAKLKWAGDRTAGMHRVIWKWVHGTEPAESIDHINRNRSDNRIWNLRAGTPTLQSRNHSRCKLTEQQVAEIKRLLSQGYGQTQISKLFPVTNKTIHYIAKGKLWIDVSAETHQEQLCFYLPSIGE